MAEYFKGTVIASPIVNTTSGDTYGTHHSVLGIGGYMEVKTVQERDLIPMDSNFPTIYFDGISSGRRRLGMLVHVLEDDTIYQLHPKSGSNYITYNTWTGYTNIQKYLALSANTSWYSLFTTSSGSTVNGESIYKTYSQTTHSFVKGDVIGFDGSDFVKVSSSSAFNVEPLGIVSVSDFNGSGGTNTNFILKYSGFIDTTGILDYTGGTLVNGTTYYLASSGYTGKLTKYNPNTLVDVSKPILVKTSGNTGIVLQYRSLSKQDQGLTIGEFNTYTGKTQLFLNDTVSGATNIGYFSGQTGLQTLSILTSDSLYNGNYNSLYNYYYRDTNGVIRIGSPSYNGTLRRGYVSTFTPKRSWLYNTYTGASNQIGWILVSGDISTNVGNFLTANPNSGTPVFTETEWWYTGGTGNDGYYSNSAISLDVNGNVYTGSTFDNGGPIFKEKTYHELRLRTIVSNSPSTIKVTYDDNFVYISGSTSGSTISGGTFTGVTGITNIGTGFGIYDSLTNNTVLLKSIIGSGSTSISSTTGGTLIVYTSNVPIDTITGVTNIGSGEGIYSGITNNNLLLKSLVGSGNTTITNSGNTIIVNTSGITEQQFNTYTGNTQLNLDILNNVNKINDIKLSQVLNLDYNDPTIQIETINLTGLTSVETYTSGFTKYNSTDFGTVHSILYLNGYVFLSTRQMPARIAKVNVNDLTDIEIFTFSGSNSTSLFSVADRMVYSEYTNKIYIPFGDPDYNRSLKIIEIDPSNISGYTEVVNQVGVYPGFPTGIALNNKLYILTGYQEKLLEYSLDTFTLLRSLVLPHNSTPHAINSDGTFIYYTEIYAGSKVNKVSLDTFTIVDSVTLPTQFMTDEFAIVGNYLWIGHESTIGSVTYKGIYVVNKNDLSDYNILYVEETKSNWGMFYDNKYVWALFATDPGIILRINPETFEINRKILDSTIIRPNSMAFDGTNYYISTFEVPTILTKFSTLPYFDETYYGANNKEVLFKISQTDKNIKLYNTIVTGGEGIKYSHNISSGFTEQSLPNLGYVTGLTSQFITGGTNLGTGSSLYSSISNKNLQFNTIIGSGSTVVSTSGNTIIVYSSGGTSSGIITGASNGLRKIENNVVWGGTLTGTTEINTNNINNIISFNFLYESKFNIAGFNDYTNTIAIQSDNKILVGGYFTTYSGQTSNNIIRLNSDGSIDNTFNSGTGFDYEILSIAIQSDNKILVGGLFTTYSGVTSNYIIRLNSDGSIDNTFNSGTGFDRSVNTIGIQSDNKILVGGWFTSYSGQTPNYIIRLNSDGSIDNTFNSGTGFDYAIQSIAIQSDNKILVGGYFTTYSGQTSNYIIRLNSDGSIDNTFNSGTGFDDNVSTIAIQSDNKILVGGSFTTYSGQTSNYIIRLNSDGSIDNTFNSGTGFDDYTNTIGIQSDNKILVGGYFTTYSGQTSNNIIRLNSDGSIDNTFNSGTGFDYEILSIAIQSDNKILVGGYFTTYSGQTSNYIIRLNSDGSIDNTFNSGTGFDSSPYSIVLQPDNKILVGGSFTSYSGVTKNRIIRLNTNGSIDNTFNSGTGFDSSVSTIAIQSDNKILVGGYFTTYSGVSSGNLIRLNSNATIDNVNKKTLIFKSNGLEFADDYSQYYNSRSIPDVGYITGLTSQFINGSTNGLSITNNNVSLGGTLTGNTVLNLSVGNIFNIGTGFNAPPDSIALQPDNKILVGGYFTTYSGVTVNNIIRLNTDGSIDNTFNSGSGFDGDVYSIALQPDNKILVGGNFITYSGATANSIIRLNTDGSIDNTFNSGSGFDGDVYSIALQPDNKILVGGNFITYSGVTANNIIRLNIDGSIDNTFNSGSGFDGSEVDIIALQPDNKILVGGYFITYSGVTVINIIRLNTDGSIDNTFNSGSGFDSYVISIAIQSDNKILVGGGFTTYSGQTSNHIIRLNSDGSIDNTFNSGSGFNSDVISIALQPDNKILVGGTFTTYSGVTVNYIIRLNSDGSIDNTFVIGSGFNGNPYSIVLQPDNKILVGGNFITYSGVTANYIIRLSNDGSIDNAGSNITLIFKPNGLEFGDDYSSYYNARSIPDVGYITGLTTNIISLTGNTIINSSYYNNKIIEANGTFTITFGNSLPKGMSFDIINISTGTTTLSASTILVTKSNFSKLTNQWGGASVYHRGSNIWWAGGDLSA